MLFVQRRVYELTRQWANRFHLSRSVFSKELRSEVFDNTALRLNALIRGQLLSLFAHLFHDNIHAAIGSNEFSWALHFE